MNKKLFAALAASSVLLAVCTACGESSSQAAESSVAETTAAESSAAGTQPASFQQGDTLGDGRQVQNAQVAAELNRQMKRHPELRKVYGQRPQGTNPQNQPAQAEAQPEKTIQERWEELKKGEYKDLYGKDVQSAIQDRFKNQADLQKQLDQQNAVLELAMKDRRVNSVEDLLKSYQEDDSLYQEEAEERRRALMRARGCGSWLAAAVRGSRLRLVDRGAAV